VATQLPQDGAADNASANDNGIVHGEPCPINPATKLVFSAFAQDVYFASDGLFAQKKSDERRGGGC
jgi:hypothetical protein